MRRLLALSPLVGSLLLASGCAMCCAPYDYDYPATGGRWERYNPSSGRVGSAFDEAGGPVNAADTPQLSPETQQRGDQPMQASPTRNAPTNQPAR